ncbi:hypothetical protein PZH42_30575, partial [Bacteroides cellulosilyticus]|nr:hypothetical protein [Bacteroides cellulosilyticus]
GGSWIAIKIGVWNFYKTLADQWFVCQGPNNSGSDISGWGDCGILKSFRDWAYARGETIRATTSFLLAGETTPDGDYIREQVDPLENFCVPFRLPIGE